jgi:O-acetyl-ADP-ribose deacetylase (regulator of RNase III)
MRIIKGDLLELAANGTAGIIVHGCNCFHAMGGGIAGYLATRFPEIPQADREQSPYALPRKLGTFSQATVTYQILRGQYKEFSKHELDKPFTCVNLYTQFTPGPDFIESVFVFGLQQLNKEFAGQHLWFPRIGCGIGGGNWERVEGLLLEHLKDCEVTVVVL